MFTLSAPGECWESAGGHTFRLFSKNLLMVNRVSWSRASMGFFLNTSRRNNPDKQTDFVLSVSETDVALVKHLGENADARAQQDVVAQNIFYKGGFVVFLLIVGLGPVEGNDRHGADEGGALVLPLDDIIEKRLYEKSTKWRSAPWPAA